MTKQEYSDLCALINHHMTLYYNNDEPEISDYEYDQLMLQLKAGEKEHPEWVTPDSPTQKIGESMKHVFGTKVVHDVPMLSIEDVFTKEAVAAWVEKVHALHPDATFSAEIKCDGASLTLRYAKNNRGTLSLVLGETRGNGVEGIDVTPNAEVITDVLSEIDLPYDSLQIRGEVYMAHEDFERFNALQEAAGKKTAANPRNLAAGTLRQLDAAVTKERRLKMFVFNIQQGPDEIMQEHAAALDLLAEKGVSVIYHKLCRTAEEVLKVIDEIGEMRSTLDFDIDGAVVKINEVRYRDDFPAGSKYSGGHIAYKYPPEERVVVMDEIEVAVGRTGKLTFTGIFHDKETGKAARLCGTSVTRATLHNQDYINDMQVGIGGAYRLYKSGEIIPKINGCVEPPEAVFTAPKYCPVCGAELIREEDTADIRCVNPTCKAQIARTISYFASLDCMNIMGLGETLVEALIAEGYLTTYADIYHLKEHRDALVEKGLIGKEKNTDKILEAIESSKNNDAVKLLTALAIRNVGKATAKDLMKQFGSIPALMDASEEELTAVNDIGLTTAQSIIAFFANPQNRAVMDELQAMGVNMTSDNTVQGTALQGKTLVVTGTLPTLGRKEVAELIEKHGGKCAGSVSKKTDFVVAGDAAGSKLDKANTLGIPVIDEAELLRMIAGE